MKESKSMFQRSGLFMPFLLAASIFILIVPALAHAGKLIHVDNDALPGGDGSGKAPFVTIAEAVQAANELGGDTIKVAPGVYELSSAIKIEKPLKLMGSNEIVIDENGWPNGQVVPETETQLVDTGVLGVNEISMIAIGRTDLTVLSEVVISNLTLEGGYNTIDVIKTQEFAVKNCVIRKSKFIGVFTRLSSGKISDNYITDTGAAGIVASAGNKSSPAYVEVIGNRSVKNNNGGFLANGSATDMPEFGDDLEVVVRDNDFSENTASPINSFGIRIWVIRRDLGRPLDTQQTGNVRALIQGNRLLGNRIGVVVDAGFPFRSVGQTCDTRVYTGTLDVTLKGNSIAESIVAPALIAFTRNTAAQNQGTLGNWQYLHGTTFKIDDHEGSLAGYQMDHPALDPFLGPCPNDATNEALENILIYNGEEIPHGRTLP